MQRPDRGIEIDVLRVDLVLLIGIPRMLRARSLRRPISFIYVSLLIGLEALDLPWGFACPENVVAFTWSLSMRLSQ